eukprot:3287901-Rhodomonas_salina.2
MAYNGIHLHNFLGMVDPGEIKSRYGIGALQPTVLFVGRLVVQKAPDILLEAVPVSVVCMCLRENREDAMRENLDQDLEEAKG